MTANQPRREGELGLSSLSRWMHPGRLAAPDGLQAGPDLSAVRLDSSGRRAHARAAGAPQKRGGSRPRPQLGRLPYPAYLGESTGPSPAPARAGRPAPRPPPRPGPGGRLNRRGHFLPNRGPGMPLMSCALGSWQGIEAAIPARGRHPNPHPHAWNDTRRATPWNRASAGSNVGNAWPPAMTHMRSASWIFCTWRQLGAG